MAMKSVQQERNSLFLSINGTGLAEGRRPELDEFDLPLRGVALADSPVLIEGGQAQDRVRVSHRLHELGRRADLPISQCTNQNEATEALEAFMQSHFEDLPVGTWIFHRVDKWSKTLQKKLETILAGIDECRLNGESLHERIPRIQVVVGDEDARASLIPELFRRLTFFHIVLGEKRIKIKKASNR